MHHNIKHCNVFVLSFLVILFLFGCAGEKKGAELEIVDSEFFIRLDYENSYTADAKGVVRNRGNVDVKNLIITGYCSSCKEQIVSGQWFVSSYEKMPHQKHIISHLPAGQQSQFEFREIAFYTAQRVKTTPEKLPEGLEIVIESYDIAD